MVVILKDDQIFSLMEQLQTQISQQLGGQKVDIYYKEGYGVLAVPHEASLHHNNVIAQIPDMFFNAMGSFGTFNL